MTDTMTTAQKRDFVASVFDTVKRVYTDALKAGRSEELVFNVIRDEFFMKRCGFSQLVAANLCRLTIYSIGLEYGHRVYTDAEMEIILQRVAS